MTEAQGKTKAEKLEDAQAEITRWSEKGESLREGLKSKITAMAKVTEFVGKYKEIEKLSDIPELSQGAKTYCQTWLKEQLYSRKKGFTSKQTDKGNKTESDAIDYLEENLGWGFAVKNDQVKSNDFMKGCCDVVLPDEIPDIKSSYDCFSFPLLADKIPDSDYEWQIQGYLELWKKPKGSVIYVLMDMPPEMIYKELRWKMQAVAAQDYDEEYDRMAANYIYSHLSKELRIKRFEFQRDADKAEQIKLKVLECRKYIESLESKLVNNK